jgi:hypothetical protein
VPLLSGDLELAGDLTVWPRLFVEAGPTALSLIFFR